MIKMEEPNTITVLGREMEIGEERDDVLAHDLLIQICKEIGSIPENALQKKDENVFASLSAEGANDVLVTLRGRVDFSDEMKQKYEKFAVAQMSDYTADYIEDFTKQDVINMISEICNAPTNKGNTSFTKNGKKKVLNTLQNGDKNGE